nr:hypothetical protein [Streptomyces sp. SID2888]
MTSEITEEDHRVCGLGRVAAALTVTVVALGGGGAPASATSKDIPDVAFVVANGSGRTTMLRTGNGDFALLWQLLKPEEVRSEPVPDSWHEGRYPEVRATVMWGLTGIGGWPYTQRAPGGDVAVERQDQVLMAEDGSVWVRSDPAPDAADDDRRWHRVSREVFDRLESKGLFGSSGTGREAGAGETLRWGAAGLGAGLLLGAGGMWAARRSAARRDPGPPRQELIDLGELG